MPSFHPSAAPPSSSTEPQTIVGGIADAMDSGYGPHPAEMPRYLTSLSMERSADLRDVYNHAATARIQRRCDVDRQIVGRRPWSWLTESGVPPYSTHRATPTLRTWAATPLL